LIYGISSLFYGLTTGDVLLLILGVILLAYGFISAYGFKKVRDKEMNLN
jgi:hypothetical protein